MSETTTDLLNLFCDTYNIPGEQKKFIHNLMDISFLEGQMDVRQEYINRIGK